MHSQISKFQLHIRPHFKPLAHELKRSLLLALANPKPPAIERHRTGEPLLLEMTGVNKSNALTSSCGNAVGAASYGLLYLRFHGIDVETFGLIGGSSIAVMASFATSSHSFDLLVR